MDRLRKVLGKSGGFTLIELMIVVAVLAILAAILIPNFQGITQQAKNSAATSDLRNLKTAVIIYQNRHNVLPDENDFEGSLQRDSPRVIDNVPTDPWSPTGADYYYDTNGNYYVIGSVGPDGTRDAVLGSDEVTNKDDDIVVSNCASVS